MSCALQKTLAAILFAAILLESVGGEFEQWCVADPQTPDEDLLAALDWACGPGGTNCSMIQEGRPCYLPNTVKDHASFVFNRYYQKFKHRGGSCYFGSAAMITELDPSHDSCSYEYLKRESANNAINEDRFRPVKVSSYNQTLNL